MIESPTFRLVLWVTLGCMGASGAWAQETQKVVEIRFEGTARANPDLLRDNLKTQVGEPYDEEAASSDIRMLFDQFRLKAEFLREQVPGGVRVIIRLHQDLRILNTGFRGVTASEEEKLLARLGLGEGVIPDRYQRKAYATRIQDYFLDEGYYFAEVQTVLEPMEDGARLVFDVFKGEKVSVDKINFIGVEELDEGDLRSIMDLDEPTLIIFTDKLKRDVLKKDIQKLSDFARREGYMDAQVTLDSLEFNEDFDEVTINILVQENERFYIRSINLEGCEAFYPDQIREMIHTLPGEPYREVKIERDLNRIDSFYRNRGYIKALVRRPEIHYDELLPMVDLTFQVEEGLQKSLRDVIISGNTHTLDKVIRREVTLYPGEVIDHKEFRWSMNSIVQLNYFTDDTGAPKINPKFVPVEGDPEMEDLLIEVEEGGTGFFTFTFGVSSDTGLIGGVSINKRNFDITNPPSSVWALPGEFFSNEAFHGGGQQLRLAAIPGTRTDNYSISFFEPYLFDTQPYPITFSLDLYKRGWEYGDFEENRLGIRPEIGKRWTRNLYTAIGFKSEQVDLDNISETAIPDVKALEGKTGIRSLQGRVTYRDVDRPVLPTKGYTTFLNYEYAGGPLGSDVELSKAVVGATGYIPAYETEAGLKHVLAIRGSYGWMEEHSGMDDVPYFERFFAGGVSGHFPLRGFKWRGVGPHYAGEPLGGKSAVSMSAEYSIPLISDYDPLLDLEDSRVKGVIFFDAGNVARDINDSDLFSRIRTSAGLGVKIKLPVFGGMPIALYYGIPLKKYRDDERRSFNINISTVF